jgi:hypothetical protein
MCGSCRVSRNEISSTGALEITVIICQIRQINCHILPRFNKSSQPLLLTNCRTARITMNKLNFISALKLARVLISNY